MANLCVSGSRGKALQRNEVKKHDGEMEDLQKRDELRPYVTVISQTSA